MNDQWFFDDLTHNTNSFMIEINWIFYVKSTHILLNIFIIKGELTINKKIILRQSWQIIVKSVNYELIKQLYETCLSVKEIIFGILFP
jgi:hypothetical protein